MIPAKLKMGHWETLKKKKKQGYFLLRPLFHCTQPVGYNLICG